MSFKYHIGEEVIVKRPALCYPNYKQWIEKYAPDYMEQWKEDGKQFLKNECGQVVAYGPHEDADEGNLYLIVNDNGLCIVNGRGIKKNDDIVYFALEDGVKFPTKREEDGCYDIYANFEEKEFLIAPGHNVLVPTGLHSVFDRKYRVALRERSSSSKWGIGIKCGQIDSGYRGEWFVSVLNENQIPIIISKNHTEFTKTEKAVFIPYTKAICQAAVEFVPQIELRALNLKRLNDFKSERGNGALGSSGK